MMEEIKCELALKAYKILTLIPLPYIIFRALRDKIINVLDKCFLDYWVDEI